MLKLYVQTISGDFTRAAGTSGRKPQYLYRPFYAKDYEHALQDDPSWMDRSYKVIQLVAYAEGITFEGRFYPGTKEEEVADD